MSKFIQKIILYPFLVLMDKCNRKVGGKGGNGFKKRFGNN